MRKPRNSIHPQARSGRWLRGWMGGLAWLGTLPAQAMPPAAQPAAATPSQGPVQATYDFDDDLVHGDQPAPQIERVEVRGAAGRHSLVRVRSSFVPEMLKAVEDL
jgi:hypothetical protein